VNLGLGSTLAVDREALKAIGGMEPLVDHLADDYELANRIVKAGYRVALPKVVGGDIPPRLQLFSYFQHQLRWDGRCEGRARRVRGIGTAFGLLWSVLLVSAAHGAVWSWAFMALVVIFARAGVGHVGRRSCCAMVNALRNFWLLPVVDLFSPVGVVVQHLWAEDRWRGEEFVLEKGEAAAPGLKPHSSSRANARLKPCSFSVMLLLPGVSGSQSSLRDWNVWHAHTRQ